MYVAKSTIVLAELPQHKEPESKGLEVIALGSCAEVLYCLAGKLHCPEKKELK